MIGAIFVQNFKWYTKGNHVQGAGGMGGRGVMFHLDYALDFNKAGRLEEVAMHEAAHACIDDSHYKVQ